MKGIDIVVHGNIGHMSAFMAQSGNMVVLGDAGEALGDSLYEARLFVRGSVKSLGADCIEKEMRPNIYALLADLLKRGEADQGQARRVQTLRLGPQALQFQHRQRVVLLRQRRMSDFPHTPPKISRTFTPASTPKSAAPPQPASMTSAAAAPSGTCRISMTCCSSAPPSAATRWKATARNARPTSGLAPAFAKKPIHLDIPVTIAGMSFGALSGPAKEALGRGASRRAPRPPPATAG
jgi:hypothetical protein